MTKNFQSMHLRQEANWKENFSRNSGEQSQNNVIQMSLRVTKRTQWNLLAAAAAVVLFIYVGNRQQTVETMDSSVGMYKGTNSAIEEIVCDYSLSGKRKEPSTSKDLSQYLIPEGEQAK